jgi:hypothetical protein
MASQYRSINFYDYNPEWLMTKVDTFTSSCWLWVGSIYQNGYGKYGRKGVMAHRIFYTLFKGNVPEDMALDHLCRVRRCVNPDHLEIVTLEENILRGDSQWGLNARKTHCKRGHEFTHANTGNNYASGGRRCRKCHAVAEAKRRSSLKERK